MRRDEKQIQDTHALEEILRSAGVCRIGLAVDNVPYIVPVNFAYSDRSLYFHSARHGRKIDMLRSNPRVCFEVTSENSVVGADKACSWGASYRCVMGTGLALFIEETSEKKRALDLVMQKYSGRDRWEYDESALGLTCILRVDITEMTGKQSNQASVGDSVLA